MSGHAIWRERYLSPRRGLLEHPPIRGDRAGYQQSLGAEVPELLVPRLAALP